MLVYEKINYLIEERGMQRKEFVSRIVALEPKLVSSGETPSERTVYRYLDGSRELRVELLPYIAEILNVSIEDLFSSEIEYATNSNIRYSKDAREILDLLPFVPPRFVKEMVEMMRQYKKMFNTGMQNLNKLSDEK